MYDFSHRTPCVYVLLLQMTLPLLYIILFTHVKECFLRVELSRGKVKDKIGDILDCLFVYSC